MYSAARDHALRAIVGAPLETDPFPYIYAQQVFPDEYYDALLANLPETEEYTPIVKTGRVTGYDSLDRHVLFPTEEHLASLPEGKAIFWRETFTAILSQPFVQTVFEKFQQVICERLRGNTGSEEVSLDMYPETFIARDCGNYALRPHTDSPTKLLSLLIYCPPDDEHPELGTSLYVPKESGWTCPGGPHHPFELFDRTSTMPYRRNTLFAFPKTNYSFHGVEPIPDAVVRDTLLFDLKLANQF